ncbi:MAG: Asp-tRNA(Asn)/Glu-tRNA(Gln) amidotransferase subunit GatA [Myxococcota bacterium]
MNEIWKAGLAQLALHVESRDVSCHEVVSAALGRIERFDGELGAFVRLRREAALAEAREADSARAAGRARSRLHGLPIAVKDIFASRDFETTCGSRILAGFRAPYDATVLRKLREAGLVVVGSTNMDEFAMGSSTENSAFRPTRNPWDRTRIPGGSSGGSAAAVAARLVPAALGTDTGGSIRQPAALCGVTGIKPTYGRVSRYGLVAFASSLDQIGPIARSCADAALLLGAIAGHDPHDATSYPAPAPNFVAALSGEISGLRIGLPRGFFDGEGADRDTMARAREALETLQGLGAKTVDVELPNSAHGIATYYLICTAEASSNLSRYDGVKYGYRAPAATLDEMYEKTRSEGFGAEVKRRILLGTYVLSAGYYDAYYRKAQQVRTLIRRDFERAFELCDVIAAPTTPGPAWRLGELVDDPLQMYLADVYTVTANLAGLPALSLPCGFTSAGLPVGLQFIGRPLDEAGVLRAGDAYQRHTDFHERVPAEVQT